MRKPKMKERKLHMQVRGCNRTVLSFVMPTIWYMLAAGGTKRDGAILPLPRTIMILILCKNTSKYGQWHCDRCVCSSFLQNISNASRLVHMVPEPTLPCDKMLENVPLVFPSSRFALWPKISPPALNMQIS